MNERKLRNAEASLLDGDAGARRGRASNGGMFRGNTKLLLMLRKKDESLDSSSPESRTSDEEDPVVSFPWKARTETASARMTGIRGSLL